MSSYIIPCIIGFILIFGLIKKVDVFDEFVSGAKEGITTSIKIVPALIALMTCVGMFKVSGGLDILTYAISPITSLFYIPKEVVPLTLLRPISGSGALFIYKGILETYGADSIISKIASVLMGSSETTFYTIAIYFGATQITKTRHTAFCSLASDFTAFVVSSFIVYLLFV